MAKETAKIPSKAPITIHWVETLASRYNQVRAIVPLLFARNAGIIMGRYRIGFEDRKRYKICQQMSRHTNP